MEAGIPTRLSRRELRKFGLLVGGGFVALGLVSLWRGTHSAPFLGGIGGVLLLGAALWPTGLTPLYRGWSALGLAMSSVTTPILMAVIFFGVIFPIGVVLRLAGQRPIGVESSRGQWIRRKPVEDPVAAMERQF